MRSYTIPEFCEAERFSQSFYFKIRKQGLGPREMRIGSAVRISEEARLEWRREREQASRNDRVEAA